MRAWWHDVAVAVVVDHVAVGAPHEVVLVVPLLVQHVRGLAAAAARHRHHRVHLVRGEAARVGVREEQRVLEERERSTVKFRTPIGFFAFRLET